MPKNKKTAFSLIELSIVILIVGLIIAGATQGTRLIYQMKLNSTRAMTQSSVVPSIKGLILWLEPTMEESFLDLEAQDATELTEWKDINPQSASRITLTPEGTDLTGITYIAKGINGLPSVRFSASSDRALVTSADLIAKNTASTVFIVYKIFASGVTPDDQYPYSWDSTYIKSSTAERYVGTSELWLIGADAFTANAEIATVVLTGPSALDTISLYVNGNLLIDATPLAGSAITDNSVFRIGKGAPLVSQEDFGGDVAEIIVFEGVLKTSDRIAIEQYLSKKYAIEVAS